MSVEHHSAGRARWLLPRQNGQERCEVGRERKRARQKDPSRAAALAARHPFGRALDILKEQEERRALKLGRPRTASRDGVTAGGRPK